MADKAEFVDTISDATRQRWRRPEKRLSEPTVVEERSRLSHWPPSSILEWRLENLTPWKMKGWQIRLWGSK
jgi:hypothetical protein